MAKARHRKPSNTKRNIQRVSVAAGTGVVAIGAATPAMAAPDSAWAGVIQCESGGNPTAQNPTSSASGLFQIIDGTWKAYGGLEFAPRAKDATPEQQRIVAERVLEGQGPGAWGPCSTSLRDWVSNGSPEEAPTPQPAPAPEAAPAPVVIPGGERVVEKARAYLGANYVWAGESLAEGGFDCSGLVHRAFADAGVDVPRTSGALASVGTAIPSLDQAQPGDILHWPGHVAIYVGNGQMIESAKPGTVVHERNVWGSPSIRRVNVAGTEVAPPAPVVPAPAPVEPEVVQGEAIDSPESEEYTVVSGDTLSRIGTAHDTDWHKIYEDNKATIGGNPNMIYPGQVFFVGGLPLSKEPVRVEEEAVIEEQPTGEEVVEEAPVVVPESVPLSSAIIANSAGPVSSRVQHAADMVVTNVRGASLITLGGTRSSARDPHGHPSGNALDYMVMNDASLGNAIVQYHLDNWDALGVEYVIWQQRIITSPGGSWKVMENRGSATQNHMDHPHVNYK